MMRYPVRAGLAIAALGISAGLLSGCTSEPAESSNEVAVIDEISDEQRVFAENLVAQEPLLDDATAQIEEAGYAWRLGTIDGEPQAVTMDYRLDRLTLTVNDGVVTEAQWG